ncbi:GntR family transcriptional regulator [Rhizobium sp. CSW-27]|uniref:GntR family transcriptional regulator n=1 Tax=Rhizobium sp. CSW-27 TaxID=2839985 RepID=UPI001C0222D6|nr:GntR family transcriptional regulator [Rhizobium sp. CSW-27]MBT9370373.1 GntR family transcriptional regulator [Rhizobium sp. CSW-27]
MAGVNGEDEARDARRAGTHAPLRQAAYDQIEDLLNEGGLKPGQMVSQRELVERTGLTLGAIREAIPRLEAEGLLQTLPKRGLMVPSLDVSFVREAYELRAMIEMTALTEGYSRLAGRWARDWLVRHEEARERLQAQADLAIAREIQRLDWSMHAAIVGALDNTLVSNVYRVTAIKIRMAVQSQIRITPGNAERVLREHLVFLAALAQDRREEAIAGLKRHVGISQMLALGGRLPDGQE